MVQLPPKSAVARLLRIRRPRIKRSRLKRRENEKRDPAPRVSAPPAQQCANGTAPMSRASKGRRGRDELTMCSLGSELLYSGHLSPIRRRRLFQLLICRFPRPEPRRAERGAIGVGDWIELRDLSRASEREGDLKGFMALTRERLSEHEEEGERCVGWFRALIGRPGPVKKSPSMSGFFV